MEKKQEVVYTKDIFNKKFGLDEFLYNFLLDSGIKEAIRDFLITRNNKMRFSNIHYHFKGMKISFNINYLNEIDGIELFEVNISSFYYKFSTTYTRKLREVYLSIYDQYATSYTYNKNLSIFEGIQEKILNYEENSPSNIPS